MLTIAAVPPVTPVTPVLDPALARPGGDAFAPVLAALLTPAADAHGPSLGDALAVTPGTTCAPPSAFGRTGVEPPLAGVPLPPDGTPLPVVPTAASPPPVPTLPVNRAMAQPQLSPAAKGTLGIEHRPVTASAPDEEQALSSAPESEHTRPAAISPRPNRFAPPAARVDEKPADDLRPSPEAVASFSQATLPAPTVDRNATPPVAPASPTSPAVQEAALAAPPAGREAALPIASASPTPLPAPGATLAAPKVGDHAAVPVAPASPQPSGAQVEAATRVIAARPSAAPATPPILSRPTVSARDHRPVVAPDTPATAVRRSPKAGGSVSAEQIDATASSLSTPARTKGTPAPTWGTPPSTVDPSPLPVATATPMPTPTPTGAVVATHPGQPAGIRPVAQPSPEPRPEPASATMAPVEAGRTARRSSAEPAASAAVLVGLPVTAEQPAAGRASLPQHRATLLAQPATTPSSSPAPSPSASAPPVAPPVHGAALETMVALRPIAFTPPPTAVAFTPPPTVATELPMVADVALPAVAPTPAVPQRKTPSLPTLDRSTGADMATTPSAPTPVAAAAILPAREAFGAALHRAATDERRPASRDLPELLPVASTLAAAQAFAPITDPAPLDTTQPRWPEQMIARIERLREAQAEGSDAPGLLGDTRIRLHPDALGAIDVALRREGDSVRVHFTAAEPATAKLIADAQPRLTELAEAKGLKLGGSAADLGGASGGANGGGDRRQPAAQPALPHRPARGRPATPEPDQDTRLA